MKNQLFISTSHSEYDILKPLLIECSKLKKVNFLVLFRLEDNELTELKKFNIKIIVKDLKLKVKTDNKALIQADLKKINNFYSNFLLDEEYDQIIVLGDRYELLPIVQISYLFKKIIIHLHGGEITEGSWDDSIRHSISKLSHLHFVTSESSKSNLLHMGENKKNIFNCGSLGAENAKNISIIEKKLLFKILEIENNLKTCLLVLQPITNKHVNINKMIETILEFLSHNNFSQIVVSSTNSDPGSKEILETLEKSSKIKLKFLGHLGLVKYLSLAKHAELVIGNSSSFIYELPMQNIKSILITDRQKGRATSEHVLSSDLKLKDMNNAYKNLQIKNTTIQSPYYIKNTSNKIANIIHKTSIQPIEFMKVFNSER